MLPSYIYIHIYIHGCVCISPLLQWIYIYIFKDTCVYIIKLTLSPQARSRRWSTCAEMSIFWSWSASRFLYITNDMKKPWSGKGGKNELVCYVIWRNMWRKCRCVHKNFFLLLCLFLLDGKIHGKFCFRDKGFSYNCRFRLFSIVIHITRTKSCCSRTSSRNEKKNNHSLSSVYYFS